MDILRAVLPILVFLTLAIPAFGQEPEWKSLNEQAKNLRGQGKCEEGTAVARRAFDLTQKFFGNQYRVMVWSLNNLAALYRGQSRYAQAELPYKRSMAIYKRKFGPEYPQVPTSLRYPAHPYSSQVKHAHTKQHA